LHTTVFISNMRSIGLDGTSARHHLEGWGTTSIFMTMGMMKQMKPNGLLKVLMEFSFTVDERITNGWYCTQSIRLFEKYLLHPELSLKPTQLPTPLLSQKQNKAKTRKQKNLTKKAAKEQ